MRILLVDNGSRRPEATLNLRRIAAALTRRAGVAVAPVSLLHSHKIPAERLGGQPAQVFEPFVRECLRAGERRFLVLPLFFGESRALTEFIPETRVALAADFGPFDLRIAEVLCPLPQGEARLTAVLLDHLRRTAEQCGAAARRVVLVDHGSPVPAVTAVRSHLAAELRAALDADWRLFEAVMERREGHAYDFNGPLLETVLRELAEADRGSPILLSMLFLSPGRHAGPGGDIAQICAAVESEVPGLRVLPTPLVAEHPGLIEILADRLAQAYRTDAAVL
ncbi:MAG: cobalamin biosynthesis protein CbiX [Gammaproteobacteria bacterium]